jgi:hypothetical protein
VFLQRLATCWRRELAAIPRADGDRVAVPADDDIVSFGSLYSEQLMGMAVDEECVEGGLSDLLQAGVMPFAVDSDAEAVRSVVDLHFLELWTESN